MIHEEVHEAGGQMNLKRLDLGELVEHLLGQRACAMLHGAAGAMLTRPLAQHLERVKIHGHLGHGAVGQHHAAVAGARLHADLAQAGKTLAITLERLLVAFDVGI